MIYKRVSLAVLLLFAISFTSPLSADDLRIERERMRNMLSVVAEDIQKNFYDPTLKGLDWKALVEQARDKIEQAQSNSQMVTAIFALVDKLDDSHTKFIPPARVAKPKFGFEVKAFGDEVRVYDVYPKSAAEAAGLKIGDRVVAINNLKVSRANIDLLMIYARALRPVAELDLTVIRGSDQPITIPVKAKIEQDKQVLDFTASRGAGDIYRYIQEMELQELKYHWKKFDGGVGYIQLPMFGARDLGFLLDDMNDAKALIVDLRGNGGGSANATTDFVGNFESEPGVLINNIMRKKTEPFKYKPRKPNVQAPLVILVDSHSASAAEIFARHFQKSKRAIVVGDRSSGRVNASQYFSGEIGTDRVVMFGSQIAVGEAVLPDGEKLEKRGVIPDQFCIPTAEDQQRHHDTCLIKAMAEARKQAGLPEQMPDKLVAELDELWVQFTTEKWRK